MTASGAALADSDYAALASFRHALRQFLAFSETQAGKVGLTPQQHQALLVIRGAGSDLPTIGYVAERLLLKPHSATGLIDRLETLGMVTRESAETDRRRTMLRLTPSADTKLAALSSVHREEIQRLRSAIAGILDQFG
ncbi:MAG: MarR family transcriptional regulator [Sphingomonadaceae bacterium]